jgi:hypothetical protein
MSEYIPRLQEAIASVMQGMTREQMQRQRGEKWSIAQVFEHLYLTYTGTVKGCELTLASPKPLATVQTAKQRIQTITVLGLEYFPRGIEAPRQVRPQGISMDQVASDIQPQIALMDELLVRCQQRFGRNRKLFNHPILGGLTAEQWRKLHWLHGRHHIRQILELQKQYEEKEKAPAAAGA